VYESAYWDLVARENRRTLHDVEVIPDDLREGWLAARCRTEGCGAACRSPQHEVITAWVERHGRIGMAAALGLEDVPT
jgi:hypothetical protein